MTDVRFEVPEFIADEVHRLQPVLDPVPGQRHPRRGEHRRGGARGRASQTVANGQTFDRLRQIVQAPRPRGAAHPARLRRSPRSPTSSSSPTRTSRRSWPPTRSAAQALDEEFQVVATALADFPLAKTGAVLRRARGPGEGDRRPALDHRQPRDLQGLQHLRRRLPERRARHDQAGRRRSSTSCAATGRSGSTCRTPTTATSTSRASTRASASCRRCCSRRRTTCPWWAATAPAWAAARRPASTWSSPPSTR